VAQQSLGCILNSLGPAPPLEKASRQSQSAEILREKNAENVLKYGIEGMK